MKDNLCFQNNNITFTIKRPHSVISLCSAVVWFFADLYSGTQYSTILIPVWNASMRFGYFILHSFILSKTIKLYQKARTVSLYDPLTGTANWCYFDEYFKRELLTAIRHHTEFTIAFIDLDNFKKINDTFGHGTGDELLVCIAQIILKELRPQDMAARLGGDEFVVLLTSITFSDSRNKVEGIREKVLFEMNKRAWPVTLSIGAVSFTEFTLSATEMLKKADELMYKVKNKGKNAVRHEQWPTVINP